MSSAIYPNLYIRDDIEDFGQIPSSGSSRSPDIIVRQKRVHRPDRAFGHSSGTLNRYDLSDQVEYGNTNYLYVRVFNRSPMTAEGSVVDLYWSEPSSLVTPADWNYIGSVQATIVPSFHIGMVFGPLEWSAAPRPGHYCFVAVAHNAFDPMPDLGSISSYRNFLDFVVNNNNIAWRNFNVVNNLPNVDNEYNAYPFYVRRPHFDLQNELQLEICCDLPEGSKVWLTFDDESLGAGEASSIRIDLIPNGCRALDNPNIEPGQKRVFINYYISRQDFSSIGYIYARQLFEGDELGRITWKIEIS